MSSKSKDARTIRAVQGMLGHEAVVSAYAKGRASARITLPVAVVLGVFGVCFVAVLLVAGKILIPGIVLVIVIVSMMKPLCGMAVTPSGIAVLSLSAWNNRPKKVLSLVSSESLRHVEELGKRYVKVNINEETLRVRRSDYESLVEAAQPEASAVATSTTTRGWYPVQGNPSVQAYWNGSAWIARKHWNGTAWIDC